MKLNHTVPDDELAEVANLALLALDAITEPLETQTSQQIANWNEFRMIPPETIMFIAQELIERRAKPTPPNDATKE